MQTSRTIEVPDGLIKYNGRLMMPVDADGFKGYRPWHFESLLNAKDEQKIGIQWNGGRIPLALWHQLCAFFEVQYGLTKGEAQVRLFYDPHGKTWKVWAFPQEWSSSMTTRELPEHADWKKQDEALGREYICWGTVHHHCSAGAFQSGTDRSNEEAQNGIHITIGKIGSAEYDLHGRVCFGGLQYECIWDQWFDLRHELPEWVKHIANSEERKQAIAWVLNKLGDLDDLLKKPPSKDVLFPKQWIDNLIKPQWQGGGHNGHTFPHSETHQGAHSHQGGSRSYTQVGYNWMPTPHKFMGEVRQLMGESQLIDSLKRSLLEELSEFEYTVGGLPGEVSFREKFKKIAFDNDIRPVQAAARIAVHQLWPTDPIDDDQKVLVETICLIGGDSDLTYTQMIKLLGDVMQWPDRNGFTDAERSAIYTLRQLVPASKLSMTELAEAWFDYSDEDHYNKINLDNATTQPNGLTKEQMQEQLDLQAELQRQHWEGYCGG